MKTSFRSTGFTLIEIMIVLLVIGVLFGFAFLSLNFVSESQDLKKARLDVQLLKSSVEDYKASHEAYPNCPLEICTPGECLFLSLAGFHNEEGNLQVPPYRPTLNPDLLDYDLSSFSSAKIPSFSHEDKQGLLLWFADLLGKDVAFRDPWGNEYVYEFPRKDGVAGPRIYSLGPDGKDGKEFSEDNVE